MVETTVDIDAAPADVWAVLVDVERWPEWTASVSEVALLGGGELRLGSRVRIKQPSLPPTIWTVTALEPRQAFTWVATAPGVRSVATHRLSGAAPATVSLSLKRSGPLARPVDRLFRGVTRRYVAMEAEGLKRRCETA